MHVKVSHFILIVFFKTLTVANKAIASDLFGMCFTEAGGCWDLGYVNNTRYTGSLTYLPMNSQSDYSVPLMQFSSTDPSVLILILRFFHVFG